MNNVFLIRLLKTFSFCFFLFFGLSTVNAQVCSEIRASGLVYCNDNSRVELSAEIVGTASCDDVEWYSSAAIDVPIATGCDFDTMIAGGNIKYFVRDRTNQSRVVNSQVGFDFTSPELSNPIDTTFDGNIRTDFTPTQDFVLNTADVRIVNWRGNTPTEIEIEVNNYSDPTKSEKFLVDVPAGTMYVPNEVLNLTFDYNFIAFDSYDISVGLNGINIFGFGGTAGTPVDYDAVFNPVINVTASGPFFSRDNGLDGYGPFFNWDISAETGPGCSKKEVNIVQRCLEICDDGIDNDTDGETDEACESFSCDGKLLQSIGDKLFEMSVDPVVFTEINDLPFGINSLGYSAADNKVYALIRDNANPDNGKVVRIAGDGDFQVLDELITKDGVELAGGFAADIGSDGNYYFLEERRNAGGNIIGGTLYRFELTTLIELSRVDVTFNSRIADIAYNPSNGNVYGIDAGGNKNLYEFDPDNGATTAFPNIIYFDQNGVQLTNVANGGVVGGIYFLPSGKMIAYGSFLGTDDQNDMIQIDLDDYRTSGNVLVIDQNNRRAQSNDGASCPYTLFMSKTANVSSVEPDDEIIYTIEINNNTGFEAPLVTFRDSLSDYLTISSIDINDLGNTNIEPGTGVNEQDLIIKDVNIPVGLSTVQFTAKVDPSVRCMDDIIFNQAELLNLSKALGLSSLSDNPDTPAQNDATEVDYEPEFVLNAPNPISNSPICEGDTLILRENDNLGEIVWNGPNSFISNQTVDSIFDASVINSGEYFAFRDSAGCQSDTVPIQVLVNLQPVASIDNVAPFCAGEIATLNATSTVAGSAFSWILNTTDLSSTLIANPETSADTNNTYTVEVTAPGGCKDTSEISIIVNPLPTVTATPAQEICFGESVDLVASGAVNYTWTPAATLNRDDLAMVTASPTADTKYEVTGESAEGCENTAEVDVTVNELPVLVAPSTETLCAGDTAQLTTSGADSYNWSPALGLNQTTGNSVETFADVTTTYKIVGATLNGCEDSVEVLVEVIPLPIVEVSDNQIICEGETTDLVASGAVDYLWSPAADLSANNTSTVTFSPSIDGTFDFIVIGESLEGCKDTNEVQVQVLENRTPSVVIEYEKDICEGENLNFSITESEFLGDAPTYRWFSQGNTVPLSDLEVLELLNQTNAPTIFLEVTSNERCVLPADLIKQSNVLTPTIYPFPDLEIANVQDVCREEQVVLTVTDNNNVATSYLWVDVEDNTVFSSQNNTLDLGSVNASRNIRVVANENGCADSVTTSVGVVDVAVKIDADKAKILEGDQVDIVVSTSAPDVVTSSIEDPGFNWVTNEGRETRTPDETATYQVTATNGGCTATDTVTVIVVGSLNAPYFFSPNNDDNNDAWIVNELNNYDNTQVTIFNRWGSKIITLDNQENVWDGLYRSGEPVPEGVYYYVVEGEVGDRKVSLTGYVTIAK